MIEQKYLTVFMTLKDGERVLVTWCDPDTADAVEQYLRQSGVVPPGTVLMSTLVPAAPFAIDYHKEKYPMLNEPLGEQNVRK